jgi:integrase
MNADKKLIIVYGKTIDELCQKYEEAEHRTEDDLFSLRSPTVKEYCEKWLLMQSANVRSTTLIDYTSKVNRHIIKPLGHMRMTDVTADDIKLALVPVSQKSASVFKSVNILLKCIFNSAEDSKIITYNPTRFLSQKGGGIPQKDRESLTDAQVALLLKTIRDLPPYVFVMLGLYAGLRREEILALQWDCVHLEGNTPYISVRRAWHSEKNRPVVSTDLKTPAAKRDVPIPENLADCLRKEKEKSISEYVIADRNGQPLSYSQFVRIWNYIKVRSTKERTLYKYVNGQAIKKKFKPEAGQKCVNRENIVYSLDFTVTPHQLRHTYITNLIYAGIDPKTVQYLAGHENSKVTMDIYAKAKYNKPEELSSVVNNALKKPVKSESGAKTGQ